MKSNLVYILDDRGILFIHGKDAEEFLQNLITNDIRKVTTNSTCYASLLSPQGKYLYDFLIIKHKDGFILDCDKSQSENLFNQLSSYKLRSKIEILNLTNEFVVAAFSYEKYMSFEDAKDELGFTFKYREDPIFLDPRNKKLGARLIINLEKLYLSLKKLNLTSSNKDDYYKNSSKLGVPQSFNNKLQLKLFGIEFNLEELNGLDFKKGCYIGQENTSRIKNKNKLNKRLLPLKVLSGNLNEGDPIIKDSIEIGKILINGKQSYGLIKFTDKKFDFDFKFQSGSSSLMVVKPEWIKF